MSVMDYKGDKVYPAPEDRIYKKDFPSEEELFTYGVDVPVPGSMDELRCEYIDDEKFPFELEQLEGYKVPPLGITLVYKNGVGRNKRWTIFKAGTFREDKFTLGKEFGAKSKEMIAIREDNRESSMIEGIRQSFEERGIEIDGRDNADVLGAMTKIAMDKVHDDASAREARLFVELMYKILGKKEENKERREDKALDMAEHSMDLVQQVLELSEQLIAEKKGEIVEAKLYDVPDDED